MKPRDTECKRVAMKHGEKREYFGNVSHADIKLNPLFEQLDERKYHIPSVGSIYNWNHII